MDQEGDRILEELTNIQFDNKTLNRNDSFINQSTTDYEESFAYSNFSSVDFCSNFSHVFINVTCEFPISYAEPMYGYIAPFLLATTIVANTLIVVVLSRRHMRTPTNVVLMAMALCDMFTMLFPAPWLFYMYTFGNHYKPLGPVRACQAWSYMNDIWERSGHNADKCLRVTNSSASSSSGLSNNSMNGNGSTSNDSAAVSNGNLSRLDQQNICPVQANDSNLVIPAMFHTASIWLTLALAVQRYIYVCHAPVARTWCTMPRVMKGLIYISVAAFLHQLPRFVDRDFVPHYTVWRGRYEEVCSVEMSPWVNSISLDAYFITYFGFRVLFVHLIPCTSLVVLNVLLFRAMRQAQINRQKLFKENRKSECKRLRDSNCTTLMLIVVVTVFLMVEIPVAVVTVLHIISSTMVEILDYRIANILILVTNFFIIVSYPINFAIYCGMSRQFRETFKELFIRGAVTSRKNGGSSRYSLVNGPRTCTNETVL